MGKKYLSNKDETIRLFENDGLELLSRVHWSVPLVVFSPVVLYCLYQAFAVLEFSAPVNMLWFIIGLAVWSAAEYFLHRLVFHFKPWGPRSEKLHFLIHGIHHDYPMDSKRLVMPPVMSLPLATIFYGVFALVLGPLVTPMFAGFIAGYLGYDMTHYAIHHFNFHSPFWLAVKNYHVKHHFQDPARGFGVTSPIWDLVMHTNFLIGKEDRVFKEPEEEKSPLSG
jgi:4-hydroxysphinganine ceramide fatty acyl 2-hydroxylase